MFETSGNWESLDDSVSDSHSHRLKVPCGWIVRTIVKKYGNGGAHSCQTFVADPEHNWKIDTRY